MALFLKENSLYFQRLNVLHGAVEGRGGDEPRRCVETSRSLGSYWHFVQMSYNPRLNNLLRGRIHEVECVPTLDVGYTISKLGAN